MKYNNSIKTITFILVALFTFSCKDDSNELASDDIQNVIIEVDGIDRDINHAIVILENEIGILQVPFENDPANNRLLANIQSVSSGTYTMTISVFEGEDYLQDYPEARGSIHQGLEYNSQIEIRTAQNSVIVPGPDRSSDADILPIWSNRFYFTFRDEGLLVNDLVLSLPDDVCQMNWNFLPTNLSAQPDYTYMDFFVWDENNSVYSAFEECNSNCDPLNQLSDFSGQLLHSANSLCSGTEWTMADIMIILDFNDQEEDITFFMRWDKQGAMLEFLSNDRFNSGRN